MKNKIILVRGIQGSGKSTWARQWVEADPEHRVRFNNDDVRNMCGKYWVPSREPLIADIKNELIHRYMYYGYDIVIDNMNLNPKEIEWVKNIIDNYNRTHNDEYTLELRDFKTPVDECIRRDALREHPIGEEVIMKTYEKYKLFYEQDN